MAFRGELLHSVKSHTEEISPWAPIPLLMGIGGGSSKHLFWMVAQDGQILPGMQTVPTIILKIMLDPLERAGTNSVLYLLFALFFSPAVPSKSCQLKGRRRELCQDIIC